MASAAYSQPVLPLAPNDFTVHVLAHDGRLIAAFVCPIEAFRYAALIYDGASQPMLQRPGDGAAIPFSLELTSAELLAWSAAPASAEPRARAPLTRRGSSTG